MTTVLFLAEWALRSSVLILSGAVLLWLLRVKDPSIRLAAWTAVLCGSLTIPLLTLALPEVPLAVTQVAGPSAETQVFIEPASMPVVSPSQSVPAAKPFDWARAALIAYVVVAGGLLLRLLAGWAMTRRLRRRSRATGRVTDGIEVRESAEVASPVTLGIVHTAIVLPADWNQWDSVKLEAVLAHERSHIRRNDPAAQLLSAIHRALLWFSPLSWFLHQQIVRLAEDASDDAALAGTKDRAWYAELLLDFMQRGVRGSNWQGVAMARYANPGQRIDRILNGTALSRGVSRLSLAAILLLGLPLAYLAAAAQPQRAPQAPNVATQQQASPTPAAAVKTATPQSAAKPSASPRTAGESTESDQIRRYMIFMGDSTSGSWDSRDPVDQNALRARFGDRFAWFRKAGNEYVVTDSNLLAELEKAMEPQRKVNQMQDEVNKVQSVVNELQSKVNTQQGAVNALQHDVNQRQALVNKIQSSANEEGKDKLIQKLELAIRELRASGGDARQETVNKKQAEVNEAQARVNERQFEVNVRQQKVNEEQHLVSAEYSRQMRQILNSALQRGLAQPLKAQ